MGCSLSRLPIRGFVESTQHEAVNVVLKFYVQEKLEKEVLEKVRGSWGDSVCSNYCISFCSAHASSSNAQCLVLGGRAIYKRN